MDAMRAALVRGPYLFFCPLKSPAETPGRLRLQKRHDDIPDVHAPGL